MTLPEKEKQSTILRERNKSAICLNNVGFEFLKESNFSQVITPVKILKLMFFKLFLV